DGDDDVGGADGVFHRVRGGDRTGQRRTRFLDEPAGPVGRVSGDQHGGKRPHERNRFEMPPRLHAGTDDREDLRVLSRPQTRAERRNRGGADAGYRGGIEQRANLPGLAVREDDLPLMAVETTRRIVTEDEEEL